MAFLSASQTMPLTAATELFASELSRTSSLSGSTSSPLAFDTDANPAYSRLVSPDDDKVLPALNMVIRQDPFSLTLDASALLVCSFLLLTGMHFIPRMLLESSILAVPFLLLIRNDYRNFLALGPGGTPPTLAGYTRLAWLRIFALHDPFSPPISAPGARPAAGILAACHLPYRPGPMPTVAGLAPQRQLDQHGSAAAVATLTATLALLAARHPARFGAATSCLEKHGFALFARHPVNVCGNGEVCHIHNSDRSLHLNLHPDDIAEVLAKGWGQRHPLAWGGVGSKGAFGARRWWWLPMRVTSPLPSRSRYISKYWRKQSTADEEVHKPETFMLVYAPRDESDLRVVCKIIEAAIWYTVEESVDLEALLTT